MQTVTAHGAHMPVIGFGTFRSAGEDCARAVEEALKVGYRAVDTAAGYRNEDRVAEGIRASGVKREDIFITTKVPPEQAEDSAFKATRSSAASSCSTSTRSISCSSTGRARRCRSPTTIASLNACKEAGWTRHIGVSNFTVEAARGGLGGDRRAAGHQPVRVPPLSQSGQADRGLPRRTA